MHRGYTKQDSTMFSKSVPIVQSESEVCQMSTSEQNAREQC